MLSSIVPQAEYAEDQKAAKSILTAHVLYRGLQTGAVIGLGIGLVQGLVLRKRNATTALVRQAILRSTGTGVAVGIALMIVGLPFHMRGRQDLEWSDRSYRLLANKPQEQVDDWTVPSTAVGIAAVLANGSVKGPGAWRALAGGAGLGSLAGLGAMMVYRLAVQKKSVESVKPSGPVPVSS